MRILSLYSSVELEIRCRDSQMNNSHTTEQLDTIIEEYMDAVVNGLTDKIAHELPGLDFKINYHF